MQCVRFTCRENRAFPSSIFISLIRLKACLGVRTAAQRAAQ
jgi:hypothetical protein